MIIPFSSIYADSSVDMYPKKNISRTLGAENYEQVRANIRNMIDASRMNSDAEKKMQDMIDSQRHISVEMGKKYPFPTINQTQSMILAKPMLAKLSKYYDVSQRDWYAEKTRQDKQDIMVKLRYYHDSPKQPMPVVTCHVWDKLCDMKIHNLKTIVSNSTTNSTIPALKPEYLKHSSGVIQNNSTVQNWNDLQKYLINKTK